MARLLKEAFRQVGTDPVGYARVLRVGGTKTPCYDCGEVMGVHPPNRSPGMPRPTTTYKYRRDPKERDKRVWTMQQEFGAGFPDWRDPEIVVDQARSKAAYKRSGRLYEPMAEQGYNDDQRQRYAKLQAAVKEAIGIDIDYP